MPEGIFNDNSFTIPIQRPADSSCYWCYPLPCANAFHTQRVVDRSPYDGFGERTTSSQCRCLDCQQKLQWQKRYNIGEQGKPNRSGNKSNGVYREIPIRIVSQGRQLQDTPQKTTARRHQPRMKKGTTVSCEKSTHIGNDVRESCVPDRKYSPEERQIEENSQLSHGEGIKTEENDRTGNESLKSADMVINSVTTEGVEGQEVKELKLEKIAQISVEVKRLAEGVTEFEGKEKCKEYLYLEEMLMKCLLRLDEISTDGMSEIRKSRKEVATTVNEELKRLEEKLKRNLELCTVETTKSGDRNMDKINLSSEEFVEDILVDRSCGATNERGDELEYSSMEDQGTDDVNCDETEAPVCKTLEKDAKAEEEHLLSDRNPLEECNFESDHCDSQTAQ